METNKFPLKNIPEDGSSYRDKIDYTKYSRFLPKLPAVIQKERELDLLKNGIQTSFIVRVIKNEDGTEVLELVTNHSDYRFALEHDLPFMIIKVEFETDDDVYLYIIRISLFSLNLSTFQKGVLILKYKEILMKQGRLNMSFGGKGVGVTDRINTMKTLSGMIGCSHTTLSKIEYIIERVTDEETLRKLNNDGVSISKVYNELMEGTKGENEFNHPLDEYVEMNCSQSTVELDHGTDIESEVKSEYFIDEYDKYPVVYFKPKWPYMKSDISLRFIEELRKMNMSDITYNKFCTLFIQTPSLFLSDTMELVKIWGFTIVDTLIVTYNDVRYKTDYSDEYNDFILICHRNNVGVPLMKIIHRLDTQTIPNEEVFRTINSMFDDSLSKVGICTGYQTGWDIYEYNPNLKRLYKYYMGKG